MEEGRSSSENSKRESNPLVAHETSSYLYSGFRFDFFNPAPSEPEEAHAVAPAPPCIEVLLSEESQYSNWVSEPIIFNDQLTLLKGRASTTDVFGVSNSDLVPGKYEGGLKLWEGSIDLVKSLYNEVQQGRLSFNGMHVLELGCGHGLPGIFACLESAASVHFQDFNAEVLKCLTIPNVKANITKDVFHEETVLAEKSKETKAPSEIRFFAGDWREIDQLLLQGCRLRENRHLEQKPTKTNAECVDEGYDIIVMAETVYALSSLQSLYGLIKKCLKRPHGVFYVAGKKHYFGVGGGTRQFRHLVEQDGVMQDCLLAEIVDGFSNVREVWRFSAK